MLFDCMVSGTKIVNMYKCLFDIYWTIVFKSDTVHHNTIRMSKTKLRYSILSLLTASNNLKMSLNAAPKSGLLV